jgi:hypothetical protein
MQRGNPIVLALAHIQKTAGTTLNGILRQSYGLAHCDVEPVHEGVTYLATTYSAADHRWTRVPYPRLRSIAGHRVKPHSDLQLAVPDVRYYSFLREPLARTASHYQHEVQWLGQMQSFEEWSQEPHLRDLQCRHLGGTASADDAIETIERCCFFVGLTERFDASLLLLRQRIDDGRFGILYATRNVASNPSIRDGLLADAGARKLNEEMNREDRKLYDYVWNELFPRYEREYGGSLERDVAAFRAELPEWRMSAREGLSRLKRNLIYKPYLKAAKRLAGRSRPITETVS